MMFACFVQLCMNVCYTFESFISLNKHMNWATADRRWTFALKGSTIAVYESMIASLYSKAFNRLTARLSTEVSECSKWLSNLLAICQRTEGFCTTFSGSPLYDNLLKKFNHMYYLIQTEVLKIKIKILFLLAKTY